MNLYNEIVDFLITAKRNTYAGKGEESASSRPHSHDLHYTKDDFLYIDTYFGGKNFSGQETVFISNNAAWTMNYCGRVLSDNFSVDFLKDALKKACRELPFRGPLEYIDGDYRYENSVNGDFEWFQGYEKIHFKGRFIYECFYHGGKVE